MTIHEGNCLEVMRGMPDASVDLIATDPPYGYSFMGKDWDKAVPGVDVWGECLRVLKPGGFAFVMSAPRADVLSQMIVRIGEAGFRTDFTPIFWMYASGFPKAMNVSKAIDKSLGAERERIPATGGLSGGSGNTVGSFTGECTVDEPITPEATALHGSYAGFQPKPAVEVVIVAMKPLAADGYIRQAMMNGKGVTWLDACRFPYANAQDKWKPSSGTPGMSEHHEGGWADAEFAPDDAGRYAANLVVSDNAALDLSRMFSLDAWFDERVRQMPPDRQAMLPLIYSPKPSVAEREEGCGNFALQKKWGSGGQGTGKSERANAEYRNIHPTVKPLMLMKWLVTLGSQEGDTVLDPYVGSGTTAIAAVMLGRTGVGIEREAEYAAIARARLDAIQPSLF